MFLTVNHDSAIGISISPFNATVAAGSNEAYSAKAFDKFGNDWDVTSSASWNITSAAGGSWSGNTYTPTKAGSWTITAVVSSFSATTPIIVVHGSASSIAISPKTQIVNAGSTQTFTATATDSNGNSWNINNSTVWIIDSGAAGSWTNNVYTSAKAGTWRVTGVFANYLDTATLTVNHGPLFNITITPAFSAINAGASQAYVATGSDSNGNTWDVTNTVNWNISLGAGGYWTANTYTSTNIGNWTVTCVSGSISGNARLIVNNVALTADLNHDGKVDFLDVLYFYYAYKNYGQNGRLDSVCDFNHDAQLNFKDLVPFVTDYIADK
jgi:hypothetical protein